MHTHEQWPCGWIYVCVFFFKSGVSFFVFTCCFNRVARGGISKSPHVGGENSPFNFSGRLWAPTVDLRFCIHHCRFQQHEAMAKRGVWLWLDSTHIFYWSIRESPPQKKTWRRSSPVLPKKKGALYFWVGLVWLLLVVSLVTPKTHITLKKWWLADWQTAFPLKLPFIFCFFFQKGMLGASASLFFSLGSFASFLKFTPTSQAPWQSNSWTKSVPIGRFSAVKKMGDMPAMLGV